MVVIPFLLMLSAGQAQNKVVYKDPKLGLQFEHPKSWKVRKDKYSAVFEFNTESGAPVTVQLFSANFKDSADTYQLIQSEINRSMKRKVERQWQEEFLGVPMLLTKISYDEGGRAMSTLTGLLYTAFQDKMNFRLTVKAEGAEQAETAWHDVMLTLRTTTGELPATEDPSKPAVKPEAPKTTVTLKPKTSNKKPERGSVEATLTVGESKFKVFLPKDWTLNGDTLKAPGLVGTIELSASMGLPEEAGNRLLEMAKDSLDRFEVVKMRDDPSPYQARSGAYVGKVFRTGTAKGQPLVIGNVVGACEGVYWTLKYQSSTEGALSRDKGSLKGLFDLLFIEKA